MILNDVIQDKFIDKSFREAGWAKSGIRDLVDGMQRWRLWYLMGSGELRRRYARSKLGQLWIMLSSAFTISIMGLVWSTLWHQPVQQMLPFVAVGMIVWQLVSGILVESTVVLHSNGHYFLNQYMPASGIILSLLYRQGITFALNLIFPVCLLVALGSPITTEALLALPGILLLAITCFWAAFVIGILCTRFRDLGHIVASTIQVAIFLTPVLWKPELLEPDTQKYVICNPFAILISIVRDPLLGRSVPHSYWLAATAVSFGGLALALPFIGRYRRRLIYWI